MTPEMARAHFMQLYRLTSQEVRVLEFMSEGKSEKQWANFLKLTARQTMRVRQTLHRKLGSAEHAQLVALGTWMRTGEMPSTEERPTHWRCTDQPVGCGELHKLEEFPAWPVDSRCERCINAKLITTGQDRKLRYAREAIQNVLANAPGGHMDFPKVNELLTEFVKERGSVRHIAKAWSKQIDIAEEQSPGKKYVLDHYRDLMRILQLAEQAQAKTVNLDAMTMEEERKYIADLVLSELVKREGGDALLNLFVRNMDDDEDAEEQSATGT
jgi:DNA-binding CsgD family transcriptional regulator